MLTGVTQRGIENLIENHGSYQDQPKSRRVEVDQPKSRRVEVMSRSSRERVQRGRGTKTSPHVVSMIYRTITTELGPFRHTLLGTERWPSRAKWELSNSRASVMD
ncbi:hypothetical protein J6590_004286 [Homalodisca vitripennis]|nr:hypothetical protein J6590_004286 [Homalodisca vitripennis]